MLVWLSSVYYLDMSDICWLKGATTFWLQDSFKTSKTLCCSAYNNHLKHQWIYYYMMCPFLNTVSDFIVD